MINIEQLHPQFITDEKGNKQSVILPISALQELLEDINDLAMVAERKAEPTVTHNDLVNELKKDGLL
jgi:hypothetical protein